MMKPINLCIAFKNEYTGRMDSYAVHAPGGTNILSYANTPPRKGWKADVILACASQKEAEAVAEAWRKSYQNNGTYASMYES